MKIRLATPDDFAAIEYCARDAHAKYLERVGCELASMAADFATQIDDSQVHVAIDGGSGLTGFVVLYPRDNAMHLENVVMAGPYQGKGVGKGPIVHCGAEVERQGFAYVELYTN